MPAITGKVELVYEGEQEGAVQVAQHLIGKAIQNGFDAMFPSPTGDGEDIYQDILSWFAAGNSVTVLDGDTDEAYEAALQQVPSLAATAQQANTQLARW